MDSKKCPEREMSPREKYYAGKISAEEYVKEIEKSEEGDRKRRTIEQQFKKQSNHLSQMLSYT